MKKIIIDIWESDNIQEEFDISDTLYNKILGRFRAYCQELIEAGEIDEDEADGEELWEGFFEDVPLAEIDEKAAVRIEMQAEEIVRESFRENWDDPDESWEEAYRNCDWGWRPLALE